MFQKQKDSGGDKWESKHTRKCNSVRSKMGTGCQGTPSRAGALIASITTRTLQT